MLMKDNLLRMTQRNDWTLTFSHCKLSIFTVCCFQITDSSLQITIRGELVLFKFSVALQSIDYNLWW